MKNDQKLTMKKLIFPSVWLTNNRMVGGQLRINFPRKILKFLVTALA